MIAASMNWELESENSAAIRCRVAGLTALQSTNTGAGAPAKRVLVVDSRMNFSANAKASLGGRIDKTHSQVAPISSKDASCMPASRARRRVSSERLSRFVKTLQPRLVNTFATAEPMAPAAITAILGILGSRLDRKQLKFKPPEQLQ